MRRAGVFISGLLLWLLLTGVEWASLWFALPCLLLIAGLTPVNPQSGWQLRPTALPGFFVYFACQSLLSAADLTLRLLRGRSAIQPLRQHYPLAWRNDDERLLLIVCLNLMPGTLVVADDSEGIELHQIHPAVFSPEKLAELQARIAHLLPIRGIKAIRYE